MYPALSIITPLYNRETEIQNVFNSLVNQSCHNFEWIVIDDGSSDNSYKIVEKMKTDLFCIKLFHKNNGGKHTALNYSYQHLCGKYCVILDSDDYLLPGAVSTIIDEWEKYESNNTVACISFCRGVDEFSPFNIALDTDRPIHPFQTKLKQVISSDRFESFKTEILINYKFPEFEGEKFIAESSVWDRLGHDYNYVFINKVLYIGEYLNTGLTKNIRYLRMANPRGSLYVSNYRMSSFYSLKTRLKNAILYVCFAREVDGNYHAFSKCNSKILYLLCYFPGLILHYKWKKYKR